jgi:hypothetical protein
VCGVDRAAARRFPFYRSEARSCVRARAWRTGGGVESSRVESYPPGRRMGRRMQPAGTAPRGWARSAASTSSASSPARAGLIAIGLLAGSRRWDGRVAVERQDPGRCMCPWPDIVLYYTYVSP